MRNREVIVAVTGASGSLYALRLIERLARQQVRIHLLLSAAARVVMQQEIGLELEESPATTATQIAASLDVSVEMLRCYAPADWFAPVASGSSGLRRMVVLPCSMGTLARIAAGHSENLIERAADVQIKERGQLILVPRETPLSAIHLENMLKLARLGVEIVPAMPGFYHRPQTLIELVDFVVDRLLDRLALADGGEQRWGE